MTHFLPAQQAPLNNDNLTRKQAKNQHQPSHSELTEDISTLDNHGNVFCSLPLVFKKLSPCRSADLESIAFAVVV